MYSELILQKKCCKSYDSNIIPLFVPPNCTYKLQPLDLSINKPLKNEMRKKFMERYSSCVAKELDSGKAIDHVQVGLQMSIIKPLSAHWFIGKESGCVYERVRNTMIKLLKLVRGKNN